MFITFEIRFSDKVGPKTDDSFTNNYSFRDMPKNIFYRPKHGNLSSNHVYHVFPETK